MDPFLAAAEQASGDWDFAEVTMVRNGVNHVFGAQKGNGLPIIVRVSDGAHRTRNRVLGELSWLRHLRAHGCLVCRPLRNRSGELLKTVRAGDAELHVACFERFAGRALPGPEWTPELQRRLGHAIGEVHRVSDSLELPPELARSPWWEAEEGLFPDPLPVAFDQPDVVKNMRAHLERFRRLEPRPERHWGLIHRDPHFGNVLVEDGRIELIDFDLGCLGWRTMDLAIPLYNNFLSPLLGGRSDEDAGEFLANLIAGYREAGEFDDTQLTILSDCLKIREILIYVLMKPEIEHWRKALPPTAISVEAYLEWVETHWRKPGFEFDNVP